MSTQSDFLDGWRHDALLALQLLTRLPVRSVEASRPEDRISSMRAFPIAGLAVGAIGGFAFWLSGLFGLPGLAAAVIALAVTAAATGAMHEDGLADCADGFGGGRDRDSKLRIMRDHHIGTYGMLALILTVGLRASALANLSPGEGLWALIGIHAAVRGLLPLIGELPPARDDGLGAAYAGPNRSIIRQAIILGAAIALLATGLKGAVIIVAVAFVCVKLVARVAQIQIGGFTGDIYGAAEQVAETAALLALAAL